MLHQRVESVARKKSKMLHQKVDSVATRKFKMLHQKVESVARRKSKMLQQRVESVARKKFQIVSTNRIMWTASHKTQRRKTVPSFHDVITPPHSPNPPTQNPKEASIEKMKGNHMQEVSMNLGKK